MDLGSRHPQPLISRKNVISFPPQRKVECPGKVQQNSVVIGVPRVVGMISP